MRKAKIVCTMGRIPGERLAETIQGFIRAGMDVARVNMAHVDLSREADRKYVADLIAAIRAQAEAAGKPVAIMGDIQGPKVRIKEFPGAAAGTEKVALQKGDEFLLVSDGWEGQSTPVNATGSDQRERQLTPVNDTGREPREEEFAPALREGSNPYSASLRYEGQFRFFDDVRNLVKKDDDGRPKTIEFWFGDGRVIMETTVDRIEPDRATCRVIVGGEIKRGQGVTVKNSSIQPGVYCLGNYDKDRADIEFLLKNRVDLLALSFVNRADDIRELQGFARQKSNELGLTVIGEQFCRGGEFPVIAKIETEEGLANLEEILEAGYGIMVARGDLGLRAGLENIGILQKQIIDRCVTRGKPVITATQMLLSMTEFREPKRPEVTDVTNAIFDGTDALMLSEETADPESKFPTEAIETMAQIAETAEQEIHRLNHLDYRHQLDHRLDRIVERLAEERAGIENQSRDGGLTETEFRAGLGRLDRREIADNICYNACKLAQELHCRAIVALTGTGGTARLVSRFKPDRPILVGVYCAEVARLLAFSYGVQPFVIARHDAEYPFGEFEQVLAQARDAKIVGPGDRVVLVSRYPRRETDTITLLNLYRVE